MPHSDDEATVAAAAEWGLQDFSNAPFLTRAEEERLLAQLPDIDPDEAIMVSCPLTLPPELAERVAAAAEDQGLSSPEWIRRTIIDALPDLPPAV